MFLYEQAGMAQLGGISPRPVINNNDGTMDLESVESSIRGDNIHFPITELVTLENTHNVCGGRVISTTYMEELRRMAQSRNLPIHLDGARIWNAAIASDTSLSDFGSLVDSATVSLSKGLGAPAGSLLVGTREHIKKARRVRKALGGGMRQAGVLAAAGLRALDDFAAGLLQEDHRRARLLAAAINIFPGFFVDTATVETNIVMVHVYTNNRGNSDNAAAEICQMLKERGILALSFGNNLIRLVTHRDVTDEDIGRAIQAFEEISSHRQGLFSVSESSPTNSLVIEPIIPFVSSLPSTEIDSLAPTPLILPSSVKAQMPTETFYEEAVIHGMSVSDFGFTVLLRGLISDRVLAIPVTQSDPMSDGLDRDQAETAEAVTLLQLLQGIDVESFLPRDSLYLKFNSPEDVTGSMTINTFSI